MSELERLKQKYVNLVELWEEMGIGLKELEKNEEVKRYMYLRGEHDYNLTFILNSLFYRIKEEEYKSCEHIFVYSGEGRGRGPYSGCIKCGLDTRVLDIREDELTKIQEKMRWCLSSNSKDIMENGIATNIWCDLNLAQAIYSKIKEEHPNIDDETVVKYFKDELYDIEKNADKRDSITKKSLSLKPYFREWKQGHYVDGGN